MPNCSVVKITASWCCGRPDALLYGANAIVHHVVHNTEWYYNFDYAINRHNIIVYYLMRYNLGPRSGLTKCPYCLTPERIFGI